MLVDTPAIEPASRTAPGLPSETRRVTDHSGRYPAEQEGAAGPPADRANPLARELVLIWILVLLSWAALIFAVYAIRAKCEGTWPF